MKLTTYKNLQTILVMGVMVLIFTRTISGRREFFQMLENGYTFQLRDENVKTFGTINAISSLDCAMHCMSRECKSFNYKTSAHSCQNFHPWKDQVTIKRSNDNDVESFIAYENDKWIKLYSFKAGSGVDVYRSYMGFGGRSTWKLPIECIQNSCSDFFRNPLIDPWKSLPVDQVKLVVYKTEKPAVTMTFNGRNSTKTNWFTFKRLLSSPWNDLTKANNDWFSLRYGFIRLFFVAERNYDCSTNKGWLSILVNPTCSWSKTDSYPSIFFSKKQTSTMWSKEHDVGDSMAIFIKLI